MAIPRNELARRRVRASGEALKRTLELGGPQRRAANRDLTI